MQLSRRDLLSRGLASVAGAAVLPRLPVLPGLPGAPSLPPILGTPGKVYADRLPSPGQLLRDVKRMVDFGPRFTGTDAHNAWIDWIEAGLRGAGCQMLPRDEFPFTRWLAQDWGLEILEGPAKGRVPVAFYSAYSGQTSSAGVVAPLAYLGTLPDVGLPGDPKDILTLQKSLERVKRNAADWARAALAGLPGGAKGRIVLIDTQMPPPLSQVDFAPLVTYSSNIGNVDASTGDYKRMWIGNVVLPQLLSALVDAGAAGGVLILDGSAAASAGQYLPYGNPIAGVPALLVDRPTGDRLRRAAEATPSTKLTLTASVTNVSGPQLVGLLPGDPGTDEVMIINTHTDGMNAFEENAGVGLVWLARYFASLPRTARPKRTLVFSAVMGHFSPVASTAQTTGFVLRHPDLVKRAAASLTLEHFGASQWIDDAHGYHPSGGAEPLAIWHSQTDIAVPLVESIIAEKLPNSSALRPAGTYMIAVGGPLHTAGVPSLSFIAGPDYLVSWSPNGHLERFRPDLAALQMRWSADVLTRLDAIPATVLKAGDTAALSETNGTPLGGNGEV